jgi:hypothetical protein
MMNAKFEAHLLQLCAERQSFLEASRDHLDGLNPDRRQIELNHRRGGILTALHELRALCPAQASAAWSLFPELRLSDDLPVRPVLGVSGDTGAFLAQDFLPGASITPDLPNIAPVARPARGTPTAAHRFAPAPVVRGLTPCPTSWLSALVPGALEFGIRSNDASTNERNRP